MLVRVDDRTLADPVAEDVLTDFFGHRTSAGDVVEEIAVIVDSCHDADLLIADPPLATAVAVARFPWDCAEVLEGDYLERLVEVDPVDVRIAIRFYLEGWEVPLQCLQGLHAHEPSTLCRDADLPGGLYAGQSVDKAFGESRPGLKGKLPVEDDTARGSIDEITVALLAMVPLLSGTVVSVLGEGLETAEWAYCPGSLVTGVEHLTTDHIVDHIENVQTQFGRDTFDESVEFFLVSPKLVVLNSALHARLYARILNNFNLLCL